MKQVLLIFTEDDVRLRLNAIIPKSSCCSDAKLFYKIAGVPQIRPSVIVHWVFEAACILGLNFKDTHTKL